MCWVKTNSDHSVREFHVIQDSLEFLIPRSGFRIKGTGARFLKVPLINGPVKLLSVSTFKIEVSIALHQTIRSNEAKWSRLVARPRALILYISS